MVRNSIKKLLFVLGSLVLLASCAREVVDLTGDIKGVVKDANDGHLIENCLVTLIPGNMSVTTSQSGFFEFTSRTPGEYTLSFQKVGYPDHSQVVNIVAGEVMNVDVMMRGKAPFALSEDVLDFGDFATTKQFFVVNNSDAKTTFTFSNIPHWLTLSKTSGTIDAGSQMIISAIVNRDDVDYGSHVQNLIVSYVGRVSGETFLRVKLEKVRLTTPDVTCRSEAGNITQNSFDIEGNLIATGGSVVLAHGHCWSTRENPTINDHRTDLGQRTEVGRFVSAITGLTTYTTYYVRAYAQNAQGITYSDQVAITTQDVKSDKWDGKIASGYAGGRGTKVEPYIIETGGQLLYALKQGSGYLKLANNIDLNNHNWKPYQFSGTLDGNGCMISNLYIDRADEDACGLIGALSGTVMNLTLRGVNVQGGDNVGAIAGGGDNFVNCHVVLLKDSKISGAESVGGIVGYATGEACTSCTVESAEDGAYIYGTKFVGGILGQTYYSIEYGVEDCHVSCYILGERAVGGIVGGYKAYPLRCSFTGTVEGVEEVGGIVGWVDPLNDREITACKVVANVIGETKVGGICGAAYGWGEKYFVGCYTDGVIMCPQGGMILGESGGGAGYIILSYSSMCAEDGGAIDWYHYLSYKSTTHTIDSYSVFECDDIVRKFKDAYSDYADYWNFDNTWTWTGTVDGKQKSVKCPRLAWE